jgi:hypothetical protein
MAARQDLLVLKALPDPQGHKVSTVSVTPGQQVLLVPDLQVHQALLAQSVLRAHSVVLPVHRDRLDLLDLLVPRVYKAA